MGKGLLHIQSGKKTHIHFVKYKCVLLHYGLRVLKLNLKALLHTVLNVCRKLKLSILLKFFILCGFIIIVRFVCISPAVTS